MTLKLAESDYVRKFIDQRDWERAYELFPDEPWRLYIKPEGAYEEAAWDHFKEAVNWTWAEASKGNPLTIETVINIASMVLYGELREKADIVRNHLYISIAIDTGWLKESFDMNECRYNNDDGLDIKVEGYWPLNDKHDKTLDFLVARERFKKAGLRGDSPEIQKTLEAFRKELLMEYQSDAPKHYVVFSLEGKRNMQQLQSVLAWYQKQHKHVEAAKGTPEFEEMVIALATKMHRYVDITHFAKDGSGRTSRLVHEYIFLNHGLKPPLNMRYYYNDEDKTNLTYIPYEPALKIMRDAYYEEKNG